MSDAIVLPTPTHRWALSATRRKTALVLLEFLLAIAAFAGAAGFFSGRIPVGDELVGVPWDSALLAGIALGIVDGVVPLLAAVSELRRDRRSSALHLFAGIAAMGWIVVQVGFIGLTSWLQALMFAWGVLIFALAVADRRSTPAVHPEP